MALTGRALREGVAVALNFQDGTRGCHGNSGKTDGTPFKTNCETTVLEDVAMNLDGDL